MRAMPRGIRVAGQGLQRREILRIMGIAAVASHYPGFSRWAFAEAHAHATGDATRPEQYAPQFFTAPEFAVITRLTELIIPTDETPGAREAGVCEFVDFMVAHDRQLQPRMRDGVAWLQNRCRHEYRRAFLELTEARQVALLEPLAWRAKHRKGEEVGQEFFRHLRELAAMGFYSSEVGYREIDNPALKYYGASPACPHVDDRAHVHLPPPKW
jgi:gluconate 2-dehydrogenase gamma chain